MDAGSRRDTYSTRRTPYNQRSTQAAYSGAPPAKPWPREGRAGKHRGVRGARGTGSERVDCRARSAVWHIRVCSEPLRRSLARVGLALQFSACRTLVVALALQTPSGSVGIVS